jgi:hypothetical protein
MWFLAVALLCSGLLLAPNARGQSSGDESDQGTPVGAGLQAVSWLLTVPYGAAKVGLAVLGATVGGLTYGLSGGNLQSAEAVWTTTMYGTYIITPEHLKGEKPVRFMWLKPDNGKNRKGA